MTEKDRIIEIFFDYQKGELPQEYVPLKEDYLKEKESLSGCNHCGLATLMTTYRNRIVAGKLD